MTSAKMIPRTARCFAPWLITCVPRFVFIRPSRHDLASPPRDGCTRGVPGQHAGQAVGGQPEVAARQGLALGEAARSGGAFEPSRARTVKNRGSQRPAVYALC